MAKPSPRGEFALIAEIFAPLAAGATAALGLRDDAACLTPKAGHDLVITADAMVEGVHFLPDDPPDLIARKLLRVNLSDLAAMAATPVGYLLTAAWPDARSDVWIAKFAEGLATDQDLFDCRLLGGDTVSTPGPLSLSVTAIGEVATGGALHRAGGRAGDCLFVSGTIGDASFGLKTIRGEIPGLSEADRGFLADRYRLPRPRLGLGRALAGIAHAAIDISDGLIADLEHLAAQSRLRAEVDADRVPLSAPARRALAADPDAADLPLVGGDDYELLFAAPPEARPALRDLASRLGVPLSEIGKLSEGAGVAALDGRRREIILPRTGWRHRAGERP